MKSSVMSAPASNPGQSVEDWIADCWHEVSRASFDEHDIGWLRSEENPVESADRATQSAIFDDKVNTSASYSKHFRL